MTPKGVTDDQLGRYYRKTVAIASRMGKSLDPDTVLWLLQRIHDGEQFFPNKDALEALSLVQTFDVEALERFAAKEKFRRLRKESRPVDGYCHNFEVVDGVKVHVFSHLFLDVFLSGREGKIENRIAPATLRVHRFNDLGAHSWNYFYPAIVAALGPTHAVKLAHIWHLLRLDAAGENTPLSKETANLFFVYGRNEHLYSFNVRLNGEHGWAVHVDSLARKGHYLYQQDQIISC